MAPAAAPPDRSELFIGLGFAALAGLCLAVIPRAIGPYGAEATILPMIGAGALGLFSLLQIGAALLGRGASDEAPPPPLAPPLTLAAWLRLGAAAGVVALSAWLLPVLGILLTGAAMQILLFLLIGIRPLPAIIIALAVTAVLYLAIHTVLGVPLPAGQLW
ncbi:tripartite tricarboxylate transporter TctB family protein [Acuticoccus yangtzensis]|uniref:tripartite tricarboxylate transporter TctB family protein n=1 Tax=Acuticoccus yangtzensis TaxID=1443441 RepID=UPI000949674E|nr:tripartite tricarboxylate transporter TctB family protein [Acuticoccus yangtzensis]